MPEPTGVVTAIGAGGGAGRDLGGDRASFVAVKVVAATPLKVTPVTPVKPVPVRVTVVPTAPRSG